MKGDGKRDNDRKRGHIATFTLSSGESEQCGLSSISSGLMCWREPGGGNITRESRLDAERAGGREINGDPPGGYTKEKSKTVPLLHLDSVSPSPSSCQFSLSLSDVHFLTSNLLLTHFFPPPPPPTPPPFIFHS